MSKVVFKQGEVRNLPKEASPNVLLFTTDTGELFKGQGTGKPLLKFSSLIILETENMKSKLINPINDKMYFVKDSKTLYIYLSEWVKVIGESGSGSVKSAVIQRNILNATKDQEIDFDISNSTELKVLSPTVLKFVQGQADIFRILYDFDSKENLVFNDFIIEVVNGKVKFKSNHVTSTDTPYLEYSEDGSKIFKIKLNTNEFKQINSLVLNKDSADKMLIKDDGKYYYYDEVNNLIIEIKENLELITKQHFVDYGTNNVDQIFSTSSSTIENTIAEGKDLEGTMLYTVPIDKTKWQKINDIKIK